MRIAIAGKGGAGKTTIAATLARLRGRLGSSVVAIDGDSNPNLASALGINPSIADASPSLPASLVSRRLDGGPALTASLDDVLARHGVRGPDHVVLLRMGAPHHAEEGCMCSAHATVAALLADLAARPATVSVVDMEASPEHLSRGTARNADVLLLVAEPYYRSLETVRRLGTLASELPIARIAVVGNKVRSRRDGDAIREFCDRHQLEYAGEIPWSDDVVAADAARASLVDAAPQSPPVLAASMLADRLIAR